MTVRYEVHYSLRALNDLDAALAWRARRSRQAAARWRRELLAKIDTLETFPDRCPLADEAADLGIAVRQLLFGRRRDVFRVLFVIDQPKVQIARIRHAAQDRVRPSDL